MSSQRYRRKKSSQEARRYRINLGDNERNLSGTYENQDSMLNGSDEYSARYSDKIIEKKDIRRKPVSLVVQDWLRENWLTTLVSVILVPLLGWLIKSVNETNSQMAVYEYRMEVLEEQIAEIPATVPNKDVIELKMEMLEQEIDDLNIVEIERKISAIENELRDIIR